ncbi:Mad3/BUB1 homology region 1-domain-containing protein [Cunninghamella echinulata]|nr:Mad3/BUB1 homology region 1-domain-containing protein [Cunninghamella echinulata]
MASVSISDEELERQELIDSIPEFATFENQKENILPLKGGRRAKALASVFQLNNDEKQLMIQQAQARYDQDLEHLDEMDDPLDVFVRRLQWLMETFPQGNNQESKLVEFLQQVSHQFQDDPRYYSDPRYLNFWIQYSKWTVDPKEVFLYLMKKGIGQNLALFYEEYSAIYEEREKYKEAAEALELGIQRNAQPIRRLERARQQFDDRIKNKKQSVVPSQPTLSHSLQIKNGPFPRTILGHKPNPKIPYSLPENVYKNTYHSMPSTISLQQAAGSNHFTTTFSAPSSYSSSSLSSSSRRPFGNDYPAQSQKPISSNFTVYVDKDTDTLSPTEPFEDILPSSSSSSTTKQSLSNLVFSRKKQENIMSAEDYSSVTFPLASKPRIERSFTVYRDDDELNLGSTQTDNSDQTTQLIQYGSSTSSIIKKPKPEFVNECINNKQHMSLMEQRFKRFAKSYIYYKNSTGHYEFIASTKECLGTSGRKEPISYEELRFNKQVNRSGEEQFIKGIALQSSNLTNADDIIHCKIGSSTEKTIEYTTETFAAHQMINALFNKRTGNELFEEIEKDPLEDEANHSSKKIRRIIDENCEN